MRQKLEKYRVNLVQILLEVFNERFDKAMFYYFGFQSYLPLMIISRCGVRGIVREISGASALRTLEAYEEIGLKIKAERDRLAEFVKLHRFNETTPLQACHLLKEMGIE